MYKIDNLSGTTALTRQSDRINQRLTSEVSGASSGGAISAALASLAAQQLRHASHVHMIRGTRAPFRLVSVQSVRVGMGMGKMIQKTNQHLIFGNNPNFGNNPIVNDSVKKK